jgi:hypothetical protein
MRGTKSSKAPATAAPKRSRKSSTKTTVAKPVVKRSDWHRPTAADLKKAKADVAEAREQAAAWKKRAAATSDLHVETARKLRVYRRSHTVSNGRVILMAVAIVALFIAWVAK